MSVIGQKLSSNVRVPVSLQVFVGANISAYIIDNILRLFTGPMAVIYGAVLGFAVIAILLKAASSLLPRFVLIERDPVDPANADLAFAGLRRNRYNFFFASLAVIWSVGFAWSLIF